MKEYKVIFEKGNMNPKIGVEQFESLLNELAAEGWEFTFVTGTYVIFEREK
ncbi:MAG: hypothetical protein ACTSQU_11640 [Promethearchaeota archaeon]|jgi:hypothetical protein